MQISRFYRAHYREMEGYVSAGMEMQKSAEKIFLNANENPFELPGLEGCARYPEPQPKKLVTALANLYGVGEDKLLITRGADEGLALVTRLFIEPYEDSIIINPPTFGVYKVYAHAIPAKSVHEIPLKKEDGTFKLDVAGIKDALAKDSGVKLIYLTNPNNPTGNAFAPSDILEVIEAAKDKAVVILDETYAEFAPEHSLVSRLHEFPHVIILRTLSKSFALAGMRIGAILSGDSALIDTFKTKVMEVYPLTVGSVEAALKVLSPDILPLAKENILKLIDERIRMEEFWSAQDGVKHVYPSDTNFLLIEMNRASDFAKFCATHNLILRDFSKNPQTPDALRISIGTPEQNNRLIELYNSFISQ